MNFLYLLLLIFSSVWCIKLTIYIYIYNLTLYDWFFKCPFTYVLFFLENLIDNIWETLYNSILFN